MFQRSGLKHAEDIARSPTTLSDAIRTDTACLHGAGYEPTETSEQRLVAMWPTSDLRDFRVRDSLRMHGHECGRVL